MVDSEHIDKFVDENRQPQPNDISARTAADIIERVKQVQDELGQVKTFGLDFRTSLQIEKANILLNSLMADYGILL